MLRCTEPQPHHCPIRPPDGRPMPVKEAASGQDLEDQPPGDGLRRHDLSGLFRSAERPWQFGGGTPMDLPSEHGVAGPYAEQGEPPHPM